MCVNKKNRYNWFELFEYGCRPANDCCLANDWMSLMPGSLVYDIPIAELVTRMVTTAFVVVAVALVVRRFGPVIGGALAGLPIVLGPGFFFLLGKSTPSFIADTASFSLLALCATQTFLLTYMVTARAGSSARSLAFAAAGWTVSVAVLKFLPASPFPGLLAFLFTTLAVYCVGLRFLSDASTEKGSERTGLLVLRACLAGALVAFVTIGSKQFGAEISGLLLAYPIGFTMISVTIHQQFGNAHVVAVLHSGILGTISLAGFCFTLALTVRLLPEGYAFLSALAVSGTITLVVASRSRARLFLNNR